MDALSSLVGAAETADTLVVEVAAKAGIATNPFDSGAHPVRPGLGVRGGIGFGQLYLGATFMYYAEADHTAPLTTAVETVSSYDLVAGAELGISVPIRGLLVLRPQIGAGLWATSSHCTTNCDTTTVNNAYVEPGVTVLVPLGSLLFVGGDANGLVLPVKSSSEVYGAFSLHAQVGVRF